MRGAFFARSITGTQQVTMEEPHSKGKILRRTEGVGTVTPQMIEERAREMACSDGRARPNDLDRTRAREQLTGPTSDSQKRPTRRNRGAIGKCHQSRRVRKLRQFVLKTMKTFRKNWFEKVLRKPNTISV
jgi:hypothetical protein